MNTFCPGCNILIPTQLSAQRHRVTTKCQKCGGEFTSELVKIRAKRSRGNRGDIISGSSRQFDVRVIDPNGERLVQFSNASWTDFELRAKDQVIFSYKAGKLKLVHNLTINVQYHIVENPHSSVMTFVLIIVATAIVLIVVFFQSGHHR